MKNSSRLPAKMARNFTRSRRGWLSSSASSNTRQLNCSQLSSRLMYRSESSRLMDGADELGAVMCFAFAIALSRT